MMARPRRSVLYMPGSNARALEKAKSLAADALILDLEDSVAPEAKALARRQVADALHQGGFGRREIAVRVNGPGTQWHDEDLAAVATAGPAAVVIPKAEGREELVAIASHLTSLGAPADLALWAMIETPRGVQRVSEIAATEAAQAPTRLNLLIVGLNDLAKATGVDLTADRMPAWSWLNAIVLAARANGLGVLDSAYNDFRDGAGLERECREGRRLGFDGKTLIHPDQIAAANAAFAPPAGEVAWARKIIAAFAEPAAQGKGVINLEGRMVELLHLEMAKRTVSLADAIAARG